MECNMYNGELNVKIDETDKKRQLVFNRIIEYMVEHDCVSGETLQQSDSCLIDAPDVLTDIIDNIIKPHSEWADGDF